MLCILNYFISVLYILSQGKYSIRKNYLQFTISSCYKYMPKMEAKNWQLISKCTEHIGSRKQLLLLVVSVTMHPRLVTSSNKRLSCMLTISWWPKTEATNWRLISKSNAHIWSGKSFKWKTRLLQDIVVSSYNVF